MAAKKKTASTKNRNNRRGIPIIFFLKKEFWGILSAILGILTMFTLFNLDGFMINFLGDLLSGFFGPATALIPISFFIITGLVFMHRRGSLAIRAFSAFILPLVIGILLHNFIVVTPLPMNVSSFVSLYETGIQFQSGGLLCGSIAILMNSALSTIGTNLILILTTIVCIMLCFYISPYIIFSYFSNKYDDRKESPPKARVSSPKVKPDKLEVEKPAKTVKKSNYVPNIDLPVDNSRIDDTPAPVAEPTPAAADTPSENIDEPKSENISKSVRSPIIATPIKIQTAPPVIEDETPDILKDASKEVYKYPDINLLNKNTSNKTVQTDELQESAARLVETLKSFNIFAEVSNIVSGPSVTRFEIQLPKGIKFSKLTALSDDIALSLGASNVRISAIPDRISVGIEVPNKTIQTINIREVIASKEFKNSNSKTSFALGKDITGTCIVADISKMPHMLIAGTTGSGKSVCVNSLLISILYKSSPDDVKLIMIDPKMIELGIYNGIPHLLIPVVTDPKKASGALSWAVHEMMKRYKLFSEENVRDLASYNKSVAKKIEEGNTELSKLPQIIIVIDELADLMMIAAKEVEESICRIAQMARAAGMHLIIATQRPSADVITGIMKANIPSRISFAVASQIESRIILDQGGADKLIGRGDMLYAPLGEPKPLRVQGCYITSDEVEAVVEYVKAHASPDYSDEIMEEIEKNTENLSNTSPESKPSNLDGEDPMLMDAIEIVVEIGQASTSMLQRRLKLGYARAARLVDEMEDRGIVGPFEGSKPRQILISKNDWQEMKLRRNN